MKQRPFDQSDVFAFLANPATHGLREPVTRIDTHGAAVFLAGGDVYKIKRAVRFPFMDYSTLDKGGGPANASLPSIEPMPRISTSAPSRFRKTVQF